MVVCIYNPSPRETGKEFPQVQYHPGLYINFQVCQGSLVRDLVSNGDSEGGGAVARTMKLDSKSFKYVTTSVTTSL